MRDVVVLGAGFHRYGIFPDESYVQMGVEACQRAMEDAGVKWGDIEVGYCANANLLNAAGHVIAGVMGATGIIMTNVENASASGNAAFREAYLAIASGMYDVAIAIGVEKCGRTARKWIPGTRALPPGSPSVHPRVMACRL